MQKLLVATNNAHKLQELQVALNLPEFTFVSPKEVGVEESFDVDETGETFSENAELKAIAFSKKTNLPSISDDSGLIVYALNGEPGVHSKRWIEGSDHDRNQHLLKKLANVTDRSAEFITVLALHFPETGKTEFFEGRVAGTIGFAEKGTAGFGYDPLFIPNGHTQSFAELGAEVKAQLSHRHNAVEKLKVFLASLK
jgi:XTP/dITP diphosphohydrolase